LHIGQYNAELLSWSKKVTGDGGIIFKKVTEGLFFVQSFLLFRPAAKHLSKFETIKNRQLLTKSRFRDRLAVMRSFSGQVVAFGIDLIVERFAAGQDLHRSSFE